MQVWPFHLEKACHDLSWPLEGPSFSFCPPQIQGQSLSHHHHHHLPRPPLRHRQPPHSLPSSQLVCHEDFWLEEGPSFFCCRPQIQGQSLNHLHHRCRLPRPPLRPRMQVWPFHLEKACHDLSWPLEGPSFSFCPPQIQGQSLSHHHHHHLPRPPLRH